MNVTFNCKYMWSDLGRVWVNHMKCDEKICESNRKKLFLIIPGNPGSIYFYDSFAWELHSYTKTAVWGISHTGHVSTKRGESSDGSDESRTHPELNDCGLRAQSDAKIRFIQEHVLPHFDEVYLIGHSIGCYISMRVLDGLGNNQIKKIILLLPTIENMSVTKNGRYATPLCKIRGMSWYIGRVIEYLPSTSNDPKIKHTVLTDLCYAEVLDSITFMGKDEMYMVKDRHDHILDAYPDNILLYYGATDRWCPQAFYHDNKSRHMDVEMKLCDRGIEHAFVMNDSSKMAKMVQWWFHNDFKMAEED